MRNLLSCLLLISFFTLPSSLPAQKNYYYFGLNELLDLSMDNSEQVKNKVVAKGYELWPSNNDSKTLFSESSDHLRKGSSLTKYKYPVEKIFRLMDYKVALQSREQANWLRDLNISMKNAGFMKMSANDSASLHLSKDSTVRVMIVVTRDYQNIQTATVSFFELFSKVRSLCQFSVNEMETMCAALKSSSERKKFMTENAFLEHPNELNTYYQTSSTKEVMVISWKDALTDGDADWLKLSFITIQAYKKYVDLFTANGYQATRIKYELKKGDFVLTLNDKDWVLRLTHTSSSSEGVTSPAHFPGGSNAWNRYLADNINDEVPIKKGAPEGKYIVKVQYWVSENGQIASILPMSKNGYGIEDEVVRVIAASPPWTPALKNGKKIRSFLQQEIVFTVHSD